MLHADPCSACGSRAIRPWKVIGGWRLLRCSRCRLGFLHPVPSEQDIRRLYGKRYFHSDCVESEDRAAASVEDRMALVEKAVRLAHGAPANRAVLDVGCGAGGFLAEAARRGWQAKGIEISQWAADDAQRHGLDVVAGDILDADLAPATFDVATFWDSLEHIRDPVSALRRVSEWLKPGGVVVIKVLDCESYDARMIGVRWRGWAPPYHLFHFCPSSLRACLKAAGLEVLSLDRGVSTLFFRFLFAPIAIPSHHAKLIDAAKRISPRLCRGVAGLARGQRPPLPTIRRVLPGPTMEVIARRRSRGGGGRTPAG